MKYPALLSVCLLSAHAQTLMYSARSLANTGAGNNGAFVQGSVLGGHVYSNGVRFLNTTFDEGDVEIGEYLPDGSRFANCGWARGGGLIGGQALASNSSYLFVGQRIDNNAHTYNSLYPGNTTWPPNGHVWYAVSRRDIANCGNGVTWSGAKGGDATIPAMFLVVDDRTGEATDDTTVALQVRITGMTANNTNLFVGSSFSNSVKVYSASTMAAASPASFTLPSSATPGAMTVDGSGNVWVVSGANHHIYKCVLSGSWTCTDSISISGWNPLSLSISNTGKLMVGDGGPAQQVTFWDITGSPSLSSTVGTSGGGYGNASLTATTLLPPLGVGTDASGNIHIIQGGVGARILELASDGVTKVSEVYGLTYTDTATCDPTDDCATVHTREERIGITYPGGALAWNGVTIDPLTYTTDDRIPVANGDPLVLYSTILKVLSVGGQKLMYTTDQYGHRLSIYRWNSGTGKWIPCGMIVPVHNLQYLAGISTAGAFKVWIDGSGGGTVDGIVTAPEVSTLATETQIGYGWDVAANGDIYQSLEGAAGVRKFAYGGLVSSLVPIYTTYSNQGIPAPLTKVERAKYDSVNDVMWVCGYTAARPQLTEPDVAMAGSECVKFTTWSSSPVVAIRIPLPYEPAKNRVTKSIAVTRNHLFAAIFYTNTDEGTHVYSAVNGGEVAVLNAQQLGPLSGSSVDGSEMIQAYRRTNGETVVFVEDNLPSHVLMYRFNDATATWEPGRQSITVRARVTDPTQCTVTNYTDAARTVKSEDTDNSLFSGSEDAVRPYNVITGNQVAAVIGRRTSETAADNRLHSRSLEVAAPQYPVITDTVTGAQARLTVNTLNIPWGDSSPTDLPVTADGRYAYPDLSWKDSDIAKSYIDPISGLRFRRVARKKSSGQAITDYPFANAFNVASAWTNQANILDSTFATHASYSGSARDPLFLPFDTAGISRFGSNLSIWWGGTFLDDIRLKLNGSAPGCTGDDCKVQVCMMVNAAPGGSCSGTEFDVTLPTSTGTVTFPSSFPTMFLDGWALTKQPNIEEVGVPWGDEEASAASSVVTLADTHGRSFLPLGSAAGQKLKFAGSWFTLGSAVADSAVFPLAEGAVNFNGAAVTSHLTADAVTSVTIDTAGAYSIAPPLYFDAPPNGTGHRSATGHATIGGGVLTGVVVDDGGAGYVTAPAVHFYIPWQMGNFGVRIRKKTTTTNTINLAAAYATALSESPDRPANGVPEYCSRLDFAVTYAADGTTPLVTPYPRGRLCWMGGKNQYLVIAMDTGETRFISRLPHGDYSGTGTSAQIPQNPFSPVDPLSMIVAHTDDSYTFGSPSNGKFVFYKVTYDAATCKYKDMPGGFYGTTDTTDTCMLFVNQNPGNGHPGATVTEQLTAAAALDPAWNDPALGIGQFVLRIVLGNYGDMQMSVPTAGGAQNNVSFHAIFDMTTFQLVKWYNTFSCLIPDLCWAATHSVGMSAGSAGFGYDDPKSMDFSQGVGYLSGPMLLKAVTAVSFDNGGSWDTDTHILPGVLISTGSCTTQCGTPIAWTVGSQSVDLTRAAGPCPANSYGVTAGSMQCIGIKVPDDQPCDFGASAHEVATWACPWAPNYPGSVNGYAAPLFQKLAPGHFIKRTTDNSNVLTLEHGKFEHMRILTKTSDGSGGWILMLQRWTANDNPTSDLNAGAAQQFRHLYEGSGGSTYPNGWGAMMAESPGNWIELGTSAALSHIYRDTLPECCGHAGFGPTPDNTSIRVVASGAARSGIGIGRIGKDYLFDADTTNWAGLSRSLPGSKIEQYPAVNTYNALTYEGRSVYWDSRHFNPDFGSGGEDAGRLWTHAPTLTPGQTYTYVIDIYTAGGTTPDHKLWRPVPLNPRKGLRDISGPTSAISDATPYSYCYAYLAGECIGTSTPGQFFVSVPMAHMTWNGFWSNSYRAYAPGVTAPWHYAGWIVQGWSEKNDLSGNQIFHRRLSMGLTAPGGQYQFDSPHLIQTGRQMFLSRGWPNGVRPDILLYQIPPIPPVDNVARYQHIDYPVKLPKGSGYARIRFGYAENSNGDPAKLFRCTSRQEDCIKDSGNDPSSPLISAYDHGGSIRNDFTGLIGMRITVGASPIVVDTLGRVFISGNSGTHTLKITDQATGIDVTGGSVSLSFASGNPIDGAFKYATLASPITLTAGHQYFISSSETNSGDQWRNETSVTYNNSLATINIAAYFDTGWHDSTVSGGSFGVVTFTAQPTTQRIYGFDTTDILLGTDCRNGCTINVPALPGKTLFYRVERSPSGTSGWTNGPTQVRQIN